MLIQHLTICKSFHQQNNELWKRWLEDSFVMKTLVQKLFPIPVFFLRLILFKEALNCHLCSFYGVIFAKNFRKRVLQQFWFYKMTQFYLKSWCVVNMLIQQLTRCKNFHSKTDELWKRWLEDSLVLKVLVQKLFSILVFFLRFILFKEALNCHLWKFYGANLQKKFRKRVLQPILIF